MDPTKTFWVVCITLFLVIGFNAMLYAWAKRDQTVGQIELLRRATSRARQPWKTEDQALEELSEQVKQFKTPGVPRNDSQQQIEDKTL